MMSRQDLKTAQPFIYSENKEGRVFLYSIKPTELKGEQQQQNLSM
jgi:hypothetical protein